MSWDGVGKPGEDVAGLASAGFDDGQQALDELTAGRRLPAERQLPPDHGVPQGLRGGIVGGLHVASQ